MSYAIVVFGAIALVVALVATFIDERNKAQKRGHGKLASAARGLAYAGLGLAGLAFIFVLPGVIRSSGLLGGFVAVAAFVCVGVLITGWINKKRD